MLPGTVYNYGPSAYPSPDEEAPQTPTSRKGAIRVEMERRLQAATAHGARALIVRAGDYLARARATAGSRRGWSPQGARSPR